jgi:hypothetical protein
MTPNASQDGAHWLGERFMSRARRVREFNVVIDICIFASRSGQSYYPRVDDSLLAAWIAHAQAYPESPLLPALQRIHWDIGTWDFKSRSVPLSFARTLLRPTVHTVEIELSSRPDSIDASADFVRGLEDVGSSLVNLNLSCYSDDGTISRLFSISAQKLKRLQTLITDLRLSDDAVLHLATLPTLRHLSFVGPPRGSTLDSLVTSTDDLFPSLEYLELSNGPLPYLNALVRMSSSAKLSGIHCHVPSQPRTDDAIALTEALSVHPSREAIQDLKLTITRSDWPVPYYVPPGDDIAFTRIHTPLKRLSSLRGFISELWRFNPVPETAEALFELLPSSLRLFNIHDRPLLPLPAYKRIVMRGGWDMAPVALRLDDVVVLSRGCEPFCKVHRLLVGGEPGDNITAVAGALRAVFPASSFLEIQPRSGDLRHKRRLESFQRAFEGLLLDS